MSSKKFLLWIDEVSSDDMHLVGSKAVHLGEMAHAKLPVPLGFVVTANAYKEFLYHNRIHTSIAHTLRLVNYENSSEITQASMHIQSLIHRSEIPPSLAAEISHYYDSLKEHEERYYKKHTSVIHQAFHRLSTVYKSPVVSLKPSVASAKHFNVQTEKMENIQGDAELLLKIKQCWADIYSPRTLFYAHEHGFDFEKLINAIIVQRILSADKSGYAQSIEPLGNDKNKMVIEAVSGLSYSLKESRVMPDRYSIDKKSLLILEKDVQTQDLKYIQSGPEMEEKRLIGRESLHQKLTDQEIWKVAMLTKNVENYFYFPQMIEWALEGKNIFLLETKPITTIHSVIEEEHPVTNDVSLRGTPVSSGIAIGHVSIVTSQAEVYQFKKGDILVTTEATAQYLPALKKASAIIMEKGGQTSYIAQVAHHLGIPAIVGVPHVTRLLKQDYVITVNGKTGEITKGNILLHTELAELKTAASEESLKTLTKVYTTVHAEEDLKLLARVDSDGVGIVKAEDIFVKIGTHPLEFIKQEKQELLVKKIKTELEKVCQAVPSKQVIYRLCNLTANEYRSLKGGILYEEEELNPLLGFRGASRLTEQAEIFMIELEAIKILRDIGYKHLQIMIPFVRVPWELIRIKELIADAGLAESGLKIWLSVEVPSTAILLKEFLEIGIDGVCIETTHLTSLILGVDKTSSRVEHLFDPRNPAVTSVIDYVLETCKDHEIPCTVAGEAVSDYPDFIERIVKREAMGVVVRPEAVNRAKAVIFAAEKNLHSQNN